MHEISLVRNIFKTLEDEFPGGMLVSKSDLLPYVPFSVETVTLDARDINPDLEVITISSLKGDGLEQWCNWLFDKVKEKKEKM
jgi:hydrogenase nickel incorporation protein HypB